MFGLTVEMLFRMLCLIVEDLGDGISTPPDTSFLLMAAPGKQQQWIP